MFVTSHPSESDYRPRKSPAYKLCYQASVCFLGIFWRCFCSFSFRLLKALCFHNPCTQPTRQVTVFVHFVFFEISLFPTSCSVDPSWSFAGACSFFVLSNGSSLHSFKSLEWNASWIFCLSMVVGDLDKTWHLWFSLWFRRAQRTWEKVF